ncbi:MAG: DUF1127 domain-containing protein [Acetobacteraceae bacterium]
MQIARIDGFATPDVGTVTPAAPGPLRRLLQGWKMKWDVYRELGRMNDRELADLGITRLDIDRIANGDDLARG